MKKERAKEVINSTERDVQELSVFLTASNPVKPELLELCDWLSSSSEERRPPYRWLRRRENRVTCPELFEGQESKHHDR